MSNLVKSDIINLDLKGIFNSDQKKEKFLATAWNVSQLPNIADCEKDSVLNCIVEIAQLGLSTDPNLGQSYIVPYYEGKGENRVKKAKNQIGYRGLITLASRYGIAIKFHTIYKCDKFSEVIDGWDDSITLQKNYDERQEGDKDWVYRNLSKVWVLLKNESGEVTNIIITKSKIEDLRLRSPNQKTIPDWDKGKIRKKVEDGLPIGIWEDNYDVMGIGKAIKQALKTIPLDDEIRAIIKKDDLAEVEEEYIVTTAESTAPTNEQKEKPTEKDTQEMIKDFFINAGVKNIKEYCETYGLTELSKNYFTDGVPNKEFVQRLGDIKKYFTENGIDDILGFCKENNIKDLFTVYFKDGKISEDLKLLIESEPKV